MPEVETLLGPHGRVAKIAREMSAPYGTVWEWKDTGVIPPWRRPAVLDAVRRLRLDMPDDVIAYLGRA